MRRDSRLSDAVHVLLHMTGRGVPVTSELLATAMRTHPVVIRRILAGLRERGYVRSEKGHGGGWTLTCDLSRVTLRDVYEALGAPPLLAIGNRSASPRCGVEKAINATLDAAYEEAEARLLARLDEVTLAALSAAFHERFAARGGAHDLESAHAS